MQFPRQATGVLKILKRIIPLSIRFKLRAFHQHFVFGRALKQFRIHYHQLDQHPGILDDLIYGWGNMGWSSFRDYSHAIVKYALQTSGPVLECGSGLSTIMLGIIANEKGFRVYSLENSPEWASHVKGYLQELDLTQVSVYTTPLKDYGGYQWYDLSLLEFTKGIQLVVCDGPPHDTPGGRYGLLPVMAPWLNSEAIILLDDYGRLEEQKIVSVWRQSYSLAVETQGMNDIYAMIVFQGNA